MITLTIFIINRTQPYLNSKVKMIYFQAHLPSLNHWAQDLERFLEKRTDLHLWSAKLGRKWHRLGCLLTPKVSSQEVCTPLLAQVSINFKWKSIRAL